jgi:transposase-like protein
MPNCPICESAGSVKNGHIHNGKQRYLCKVCSRQFVENPQQQEVSADKKAESVTLKIDACYSKGGFPLSRE